MTKAGYSLLLIEDNPGDARLVEELVRDMAGSHNLKWVPRLADGMKILDEMEFDCVLLDLSLPDGSGLELIEKIRSSYFSAPLIILTGLDDETMAFNSLRLGAQDYLVKGQFDGSGLKRSIRYARERKNIEIEKMRVERMKDDFIGTVSHELRTPLAIVKSAISNFRDGILGPLTEKQAKVVDTTMRNIERLGRLINNLLDISRLESGKVSMTILNFNLINLVEETISALRQESLEKNITLHFEPQAQEISLTADQDMLTQVLINLSDNAIRFARKNVTIKAGVLLGSDLESLLKRSGKALSGDSFVYIAVEDDGKGIEEHSIGRLFNKFEQINRPQGGKGYQGTGLGLAICKEIVELHDGAIWADSEYGKWMRFNIILPSLKKTASSE